MSEGRWWVAAALLGATGAGLMHHGANRGDDINPPLWRCVAKPDEHEGRRVWAAVATVEAHRPGEVLLKVDGLKVRATGAIAPLQGLLQDQTLSLSGTFHAPDRLDVDAIRVWEDSPPRTALMWAVSGLCLAALAIHGLRQFTIAIPPIGEPR